MHDLSAAGLPAGAPVILAAHGITANGYWWLPLARELTRRGVPVRLLAVCLRGRADSRGVEGPYGLNQHARDLFEVSTLLGIRPLLLGHSMGAFVAALALVGSTRTFAGALLVDGGLAVPTPVGIDRDAAARRVLRPFLRRLDTRFADADAYVADWGRHPALRALVTSDHLGILREVALHDAAPMQDGQALRSSLVKEAVVEDGRDVATDPTAASALGRALAHGMPLELVWARMGLFDEPRGFYDEETLAMLAPPGLTTTCVEDANHLSVVLAQPGLGVLVDALVRLLAARAPPRGQ